MLVRPTDSEFMAAGFGLSYDPFATLSREPRTEEEAPLPSQASHVYPTIWRRAPIEGEVDYDGQKSRPQTDPENTFGRSPDETMRVPAYRHDMIDKIRRYHATYPGWISRYHATDASVLAGAAEPQKAFGCRFVIDSLRYPLTAQPGENLNLKLAVRNTGSAPFSLDWPMAVALLDPQTRSPVWSGPLSGADIRRWLPGEDWDSDAGVYRRPAHPHHAAGEAALPTNLRSGHSLPALAILDREGGMVPSIRLATTNDFRSGWHPFGFTGVGRTPPTPALKNIPFDSPAFAPSLPDRVPAKLLAVQPPPLPDVKALTRCDPGPQHELIDPWRDWTLEARSQDVQKRVSADGPAGGRVLRGGGDFGTGSALQSTFAPAGKLKPGRDRLACPVRGIAGQAVQFPVADGGRPIAQATTIPLPPEWQEHAVEFEIEAPAQDETSRRFSLPKGASGEFALTDPRRRELA